MNDRRGRRVGWVRMSWVPDESPQEQNQGASRPSERMDADLRRAYQDALQAQEEVQRAGAPPERLREYAKRSQQAAMQAQADAQYAAFLQAQEAMGPVRNGRGGRRGRQRGGFGSWW